MVSVTVRAPSCSAFVAGASLGHITYIIDHPRNSVVCNCGRVCLSVPMSVCQTITFERLNVGSSYLHISGIRLKLCMKVKVKVTGAKKGRHCVFPQCKVKPRSTTMQFDLRRLKIQSPITPLL